MNNKINFMTAEELSKIIKGHVDISNIFRKEGFDWVDVDDFNTIMNKSMMTYFISKLHIIEILNPTEYSKLSDIDLSTRTGLNYRVVTQVGNYRFQDNLVIDVKEGKSYRRYFLLDFNDVDSENRASKIYELDLHSFYLLISEICSAKQDIEDNIENEDAEKYLIHMENVIREFLKSYDIINKMKNIIKE